MTHDFASLMGVVGHWIGLGLGLGLEQCAQVLAHEQSSVVERVHDHVEPQLP
jgi:hypothetical protein